MTDQTPSTETELVEFVRTIDVRAPDALHERVSALLDGRSGEARSKRDRSRSSARRRPLGPRLAAAGGLAAVAVAVVALALALSSGGGSELTLRAASASTQLPPTAGPPREKPGGAELAAAVEDVPFPYWEDRFGWRSTGMRVDTVNGRAVTTVFYSARRGQRIGYAIFAGKAPATPGGGVVAVSDGVPYRLASWRGMPVVTWLREGHLCVLAGHGVSGATLLRLARWTDRDALPS
jgi:hypothetical protein